MKALELAELLSGYHLQEDVAVCCLDEAAAELRRLAEVNAMLLEELDFYGRYILKRATTGECMILTPIEHDCGDRARSAIAKAKEQQ